MRLQTSRETLLKPLQHVIGVVERRHTLPILANVRLIAKDGGLLLTASDLEVELSANAAVPVEEPGGITFPARKMLDILRALPEAATVSLAVENDKLQVRCGRSRFSLLMLPVEDFPVMDEAAFDGQVRLSQTALKGLIDHTHFAMAQQDVRYYLNGLLLEITDDKVTAVATDGHRLALEDTAAAVDCPGGRQVIVPRKGVQELLRLLGEADDEADIRVSPTHLQVTLGDSHFTSKLIDGKFPDY
nr:DNA polymerase III subunit beta [Pseudomonadota bacterium]